MSTWRKLPKDSSDCLLSSLIIKFNKKDCGLSLIPWFVSSQTDIIVITSVVRTRTEARVQKKDCRLNFRVEDVENGIDS